MQFQHHRRRRFRSPLSPRRCAAGLAAALTVAACGGAPGTAPTAAPADDPAAAAATRFVEDFFTAYLAKARVDPKTGRVTSDLAAGGYHDDPRIGGDLADQIDDLVEAAGADGLSADPFVCAAEVPERAEVVSLQPDGADRMVARVDMWHAGQGIPFPVTVTVAAAGDGAWQLVGIECR